jgi:hypothetical protein
MRPLLATAALLLSACPGPSLTPCSTMEPCEPGQVCDRAAIGSFCVPTCTGVMTSPFCADGSVCASYGGPLACRLGGTIPEGGVVTVGGETCARGLLSAADYTVDPAGMPPRIVRICMRACGRDAGCRAGEQCRGDGACGPGCGGLGCEPDEHCVTYRGADYCVDARRYARIDCDGDGDADCPPYAQCDAAGVEGCSRVPPEEE